MKKIFFLLMIFMLLNFPAQAEVFKAETLQTINTENPPKTVELKAMSDMTLGNLNIEKGYIINGDFVDLIPPQSWGKNATFSVKLTSYVDLTGKTHTISDTHVINYRQKLKPNWERQSFSVLGNNDAGLTFSPYDIKLMKESTGPQDFLIKEANKGSMWDKGWELKYKPNETIYFNY